MGASTIVLRVCAVVLLCVGPAACTDGTRAPAGAEQQAALPPDDSSAEGVQSEAAPVDWPRPPERPAAPRGFAVDPETLLNLEQAELRKRMGEPALVREEPPAVVWTFAQGDCRLDLYLYQSVRTRELRSLTYVLESVSGGAGDPAAVCLDRDG